MLWSTIDIFLKVSLMFLLYLSAGTNQDKSAAEDSGRVRRETSAVNGRVDIAAFNIRIFGVTKYGMADVVTVLSQVS